MALATTPCHRKLIDTNVFSLSTQYTKLSARVEMNETAGLPPPPGVESNFHSRNGFNSILVGTVAICVASATVFTIMRIAVRVMSQKGFKLEDC